MKLLVRNLARFTTEKQLLDLFQKHGKVQYCTLVKDKTTGKSKGFGFVEMPKPGDAKAAIKAINGTDIDGNRVRVKRADDPDTKGSGENSAQSAGKNRENISSSGEGDIDQAETQKPDTDKPHSIWPQS